MGFQSLIIAGLSLVLMLGCSQNNFSGSDPATKGVGAAGNGDGTGGTGDGTGGTGGGGGITYPKVVFSGPPCQAGTICHATFTASGVDKTLTFTWRTNDAAFGTPAPQGMPQYGKAGVDYISTNGSVTFQSGGSMTWEISVQDINAGTGSITIGALFENCNYGGTSVDCALIFP